MCRHARTHVRMHACMHAQMQLKEEVRMALEEEEGLLRKKQLVCDYNTNTIRLG